MKITNLRGLVRLHGDTLQVKKGVPPELRAKIKTYKDKIIDELTADSYRESTDRWLDPYFTDLQYHGTTTGRPRYCNACDADQDWHVRAEGSMWVGLWLTDETCVACGYVEHHMYERNAFENQPTAEWVASPLSTGLKLGPVLQAAEYIFRENELQRVGRCS